MGYQTDPSDTYCNKFSAYWDAGVDDCGNDNLDEEWCADFAAWVWKQAGAEVSLPAGAGVPQRRTPPASTSGGPTTAPGTPSGRATRPNRATSPSTGSTPPPSPPSTWRSSSRPRANDAAPDVDQRRRRPHRLQRGRGRGQPGVRRREGEGRRAVGLRLSLVPRRRCAVVVSRRLSLHRRRRTPPPRPVGPPWPGPPPRRPWPRPAQCGVRARSRQPAPRKAIGRMMRKAVR